MELKDFVRQTLLDIFEAVQEAGNVVSQDGNRRGAIVPMWGGLSHASNHEQTIKFDVAVTASEGTKDQVRGGIKVWGMELGARASHQDQTREVSRVSFSVPVALPATVVEGTNPRTPKPPRRKS